MFDLFTFPKFTQLPDYQNITLKNFFNFQNPRQVLENSWYSESRYWGSSRNFGRVTDNRSNKLGLHKVWHLKEKGTRRGSRFLHPRLNSTTSNFDTDVSPSNWTCRTTKTVDFFTKIVVSSTSNIPFHWTRTPTRKGSYYRKDSFYLKTRRGNVETVRDRILQPTSRKDRNVELKSHLQTNVYRHDIGFQLSETIVRCCGEENNDRSMNHDKSLTGVFPLTVREYKPFGLDSNMTS